jgi:hypothetical protein
VLRSPIQPAHATQQMWALPGRTLFILPKDEKLQKGCLINTLLIYPSSLDPAMASASPLAASIAAALPGCGADLAESVAQYLRFDPRPETVEAVTQLTAHGVDVVKEHFTPRIAFGTAGLRAAMAPGSVTTTPVFELPLERTNACSAASHYSYDVAAACDCP